MKTQVLSRDVVQLDRTGLVIEWVENLAIWRDSETGTVYLEQGDDLVVIPWCYLPEIAKALETAKHEYSESRYSNRRP